MDHFYPSIIPGWNALYEQCGGSQLSGHMRMKWEMTCIRGVLRQHGALSARLHTRSLQNGDLWVTVPPHTCLAGASQSHLGSSYRFKDGEGWWGSSCMRQQGGAPSCSTLPHLTYLHTHSGSHPWTAEVKMRNITYQMSVRASAQTRAQCPFL